jgi:tRNA(Ile)-lysidine synthase
LPALYNLEPDTRQNLLQSFARLKDTGKAFTSLFEAWKKEHIREQQGMSFLPYKSIRNLPGAATLLYFWLRSYGFNSDQALSLSKCLEDIQPGRLLRSATHELSLDREELILYPLSVEFQAIELPFGTPSIELPEGGYQLTWDGLPKEIDRNPTHAVLDLDCLEFPLQIRSWEEGDRFNPLGMTSEKKISDFLIDNKVPLALKKEVKVLVSGNKIAWVIGMRIADWAKLSPTTQKCLYIQKR